MARVLHGDVVALARVLLRAPKQDRLALCQQAFAQAEIAARHLANTGRAHVQFGNGSLAGWAGCRARAPEPFLDDVDYIHCLQIILNALLVTQGYPDAQDTQSNAAKSNRNRPGGMGSSQSSHSP